MTAPLIDYEGFEDLDDHRFLWMALLHLESFTYGWGDQEVYLRFDVRHSGFQAPPHIIARNPDTLTIVLQHHYEDLKLTRHGLSVKISFNGQSCQIDASFDSVITYYDVRAGHSRYMGSQMLPSTATRPPSAGNVVEMFPTEAPK